MVGENPTNRRMDMLLENKNAVIYGAGGAIGGAVARAFAREGAKVFLTGRTLAAIDAVAREIAATGGENVESIKRKSDASLGTCAHLGRVVHGLARLPGRRDRLEHDPPGPRRLDRAAGVGGQRLHPELRGAADEWRRARRPLRPPAHVRRRPGAVRGGVGCLRAGAQHWRPDRHARRPGGRRGASYAARAGAAERG